MVLIAGLGSVYSGGMRRKLTPRAVQPTPRELACRSYASDLIKELAATLACLSCHLGSVKAVPSLHACLVVEYSTGCRRRRDTHETVQRAVLLA